MDWLDQLKEFGNKVYTPVNTLGSEVYSGLNETYNYLDKAAKGFLPYGEEPTQSPQRMAGEVIEKFIGDNNPKPRMDEDGTITYESDIPDHPNPHYGVRRGPEPKMPPKFGERVGGSGTRPSIMNRDGTVTYESDIPQHPNPHYGVKRGSDNDPVTDYINGIGDLGLLPVPITGINAPSEAIGTAIKSRLGVAGMPFRILRSPETSEQLQRQIDGATIVNDDYINFNENSPNWEQDRFSSNLEGHGIHGRFRGRIGPNNKVVAEDDAYDTMPLGWHVDKFKDHLNEGNLPGMIESGLMNIPFAALEPFSNKYPRGREPVIGEISPGHPLYRPQ